MTSLKEIARIVGVSTATVSDVLNGKRGAAGAEKAREILDTAERLQYTPNVLAKNLRSRASRTIGVVTEDLIVFNSPRIIDGIDAACAERGYHILISDMRLLRIFPFDYYKDTPAYREILKRTVQNLLSNQVEGLIYVANYCRNVAPLPSWVGVPFAFAHCIAEGAASVIFDDRKAILDMMSLMRKRGYRKFGALTGPAGSFHTQERLEAFREEINSTASANLTPMLTPPPTPPARGGEICGGEICGEEIVVEGFWSQESGYELADGLLDQGVDAIVAFNDDMAAGVCVRMRERGLEPGRDVGLTGFDNHEISRLLHAGITTADAPLEGIGRACAEMVMDAVEGHGMQRECRKLPCRIIERESTQR
jgi:LacI family transcriptional regulator